MIQLKNVEKSFFFQDRKIDVLKNINLALSKGESLSIIGPSGSGKTTLLSLLSGLDHPSQGEVWIGDKRIDQLSEEEVTRFRGENIGIVFQNFHLVTYLTTKENVELAMDLSGNKEDPKAYLEKVGLSDRENHFPFQLSGGESQRLAIARALAVKPKIIIADEPSGNLDRETGKKVMDLLFQLVEEENTTLILVTHDEELAKRSKKLKKIDGGQLIDVL